MITTSIYTANGKRKVLFKEESILFHQESTVLARIPDKLIDARFTHNNAKKL